MTLPIYRHRLIVMGTLVYSMVEAHFRTVPNDPFILNWTGVEYVISFLQANRVGSGATAWGSVARATALSRRYAPELGAPGGQVEPGEELLAGLQRELLEETGITMVGTPTIAFVIQVLRETEEGIQQWLACHFACEVAGQISPQDPDGLVFSAHWVEEQAALEHLGMDSGYDCEPLRHWLCGGAAPGTVYTVKVK